MTDGDPGKTGSKQGGRFKPGQSGNPAGKPRGVRNKASLMAEKLMADDAAEIVRAVLGAAKGGDMTAARLVLDRLCPSRRDNPVAFELPKIETAGDAAKAMGAILAAVADGVVTPIEAEAVARLVETHLKAIELHDFERRLKALEAK